MTQSIRVAVFLTFALLILISPRTYSQKPAAARSTDLAQLKKVIEENDRQFSTDFRNGDSVALANHYSSDGQFGNIKGTDHLIPAWGKMIRDARADSTPNVIFKTNAVSTDGQFVTELGEFKMIDKDNKAKSQGKFIVIWKQEGGKWKMYRDEGL